MDKTIFALLPLSVLILAGCSLIGLDSGLAPAELATQHAREDKVATLVQGTLEAGEQQTQTAPTPSPTPGTLPIAEALLDTEAIKSLMETWPEEPGDPLDLSDEPLCIEACAGLIWQAGSIQSRLAVRLYETTGRDHAVTLLQELRRADGEAGHEERDPPAIASLPPETWIVLDADGEYLLRTRRGKAIVEISLLVPQLEEEQNVLLLSLYAEQQLEKLKLAGF